jgi:hypothetical protein
MFITEEDESDEEDQEFDAPVLHKKQRMILFTFFASIRTCSCYLIKHWAQVESQDSSSGAFISLVERVLQVHSFRGWSRPGKTSSQSKIA